MSFKFNPLIFSGLDLAGGGSTLSIGTPVGGADSNAILVTDGSGNLADKVLTNGALLIGSTGAAPVVATLTGTANQVIVTNGAGSITLSLPQSINTTSSPTFANLKLSPSGTVDTTTTGTLAIGTANANVINIGNSGATVNIQGTTLYENVTQLQVTDPLITINKGGGTGSASGSGIEIEEAGTIAAYSKTSADRLSYTLKAPATAGIATITPGSAGITLDQSSHNPVTLGTASGLSLSTQVLSLAVATSSVTGALSSTDWTTFNNKQPAGNYITALTGDISAAGPGSAVATLATVNASPGSTGSASSTSVITTNAKGLVTSNTSTSIQIAESQVTNLVSDLAGKQPTGNYITALTGDAAASGPGSATLTLATVNSNVGTFNNVTVNAKGLVTAASNVSYVVATTGDVASGSFSGLANNTANQSITGLSFANSVSSFEALLNIQIVATSNTYTTVKIFGTNRGTWASGDISAQFMGDAIPGLALSITSSGVVTVSIGSVTGFTSGTVKFRAITLS